MSALALALSLCAAAPGDDDPVLRAMADEVKRAMTLSMPATGGKGPTDKPHFARAYVISSESFGIGATFGALHTPSGGRELSLATGLRVGTPKLDQTNFSGQASSSVRPAPGEEDVDALRRALWLSFDGLYKNGVEALARKRAFLLANQVKDVIDDWGRAPAEQVVLPLEPAPKVDEAAWTARVKAASAVCRASKAAHTCSVTYRMRHQCQRLVASDGARSRFCDARHELAVSASGQAQDGMPVGMDWSFVTSDEQELPSQEALVARVKETYETLEKKLAAPAPTEDYVGPVLFTGEAAPAFFLVTVAGPLSAPRDPLGSSEQGRLTERLGKHIAVSQVNVVDDPTQRTWKAPDGSARALIGGYPVDDDGVTPKAITLVKEGVLSTYFMSRIPTKSVPLTNGHARGDQASASNLFVTTTQPQSLAALKKRLVELAKEEDTDCGLMVRALPQRLDTRHTSQGVQLPNVPPLVFRVCADGSEKLVRGYNFKPASLRMLKDIVGMGDDPTLLNAQQFGQDVSAVAPSVLVKTMELTRSRDDYGKPPVLARPSLAR